MTFTFLKRLALACALVWMSLAASGTPGASAHWNPGDRGAPSAWRETVSRPAPGVALIDQNGRPFSLSKQKGKAILLTFIFTSCPDLCPLITAKMAGVAGRLGPEAPLHLVSITTDPEVDRPEVLLAYARRFAADSGKWSFLTGAKRVMEQIWRAYGVSVAPISKGLVNHNYVLALIDANGVWRATYHGENWDVRQVVEELLRILPTPVAMER
ncbi:MAG: SCO family protein [Nitrospinota bacterium]